MLIGAATVADSFRQEGRQVAGKQVATPRAPRSGHRAPADTLGNRPRGKDQTSSGRPLGLLHAHQRPRLSLQAALKLSAGTARYDPQVLEPDVL